MSFFARHLDPSEILGELLFGLIMVLTFTLGASLAGGYERGLLLSAIRDEFEYDVEEVATPEDREQVYRSIHALFAKARPLPMRFRREEAAAAFAVFLLVTAPVLPAALPFFLVADPHQALRASNALLIALLFAAGWRWGRHVEVRAWLSALLLTSLGVGLVVVAIALGG
jgi:VIT1/CCC1 family predicted Fe2+/Mn2+ transporter